MALRGCSRQERVRRDQASWRLEFVAELTWACSSFIQVPFLNLLATVADRAGRVRIRVGGNTQETATLVDSLPDNEMIAKDKTDATNPVRCYSLLAWLLFRCSRRSPWICGGLGRFRLRCVCMRLLPCLGCVLPWQLFFYYTAVAPTAGKTVFVYSTTLPVRDLGSGVRVV